MSANILSADLRLNELKDLILEMGGYVEEAIGEAMLTLVKRDHQHLLRVQSLEAQINSLHVQVDDVCWKILAQQSPVAKDLRTTIAAIKMNTDLERMGDQALNIARNAAIYLTGLKIKLPEELETLAIEVKKMVKLSLDSLVSQNTSLAKEVILLDDKVDALKNSVQDLLIEQMNNDQRLIDNGVRLVMIAKNMERLGDHATNIAEDVIFIMSGKDVRHNLESSNG